MATIVLDDSFVMVLAAAFAGIVLSIAIERLLTSRPRLLRPWAAWCLHAGLWLLAYGALVSILARPWFACAAVSAFLLLLVLVNNAKVKALREPFVFQDFEYFTDAIRHPRLYIPFLGWTKFLIAVLGFTLAVAVGLWGEAVPAGRFAWNGQLGGIVVVLVAGALQFVMGARRSLPVGFLPESDVVTFGFLASLWRYAEAERERPVKDSLFDQLQPQKDIELPHLIAVQSESFFDARTLYGGIRRDVLAEFDRLKEDAVVCGKLKVPAWGANTVRTEFAFLSGLDDARLDVHRFNPYRAVADGWNVPSLAAFLKKLGYRTVCVHPYPMSFYQRDRVYPRFGFDEFIDIRAFAENDRFGPYIGDTAVAAKVADILDHAGSPTFVFVITMENHGPLHLEKVAPGDLEALYTAPPPAGCDDLTIYLRHQRNANRMIQALRERLEHCQRPAGLCWYGDHVPIMPAVYDAFGAPDGDVEFVFWHNRQKNAPEQRDLNAHLLSIHWLQAMGLVEAVSLTLLEMPDISCAAGM